MTSISESSSLEPILWLLLDFFDRLVGLLLLFFWKMSSEPSTVGERGRLFLVPARTFFCGWTEWHGVAWSLSSLDDSRILFLAVRTFFCGWTGRLKDWASSSDDEMMWWGFLGGLLCRGSVSSISSVVRDWLWGIVDSEVPPECFYQIKSRWEITIIQKHTWINSLFYSFYILIPVSGNIVLIMNIRT